MKIQFDAETCWNFGNKKSCPFLNIERTIGAGYALDYTCVFGEPRMIAGYVEYDYELPKTIPAWCPARVTE